MLNFLLAGSTTFLTACNQCEVVREIVQLDQTIMLNFGPDLGLFRLMLINIPET